ncbi:MAG: ABC-F family ATP-binding cassette domain-containing protein [Anaerolineae bacterium]
MALLSGRNLTMRYGPFDIFQNLNLSVHHGERVAVVGPNGQGKTTLLRILAGEETPVEGEVIRAKGLHIGYLRQEAALVSRRGTLWQLADGAFDDLKAQARQLAAMEEALAGDSSLLEKYGHVQQAFELAGGYTYKLTIEQVLTGLGFTPDTYHQPLRQFSGGQQTRAQLARLLLERPTLLLLDEPTNHLDLAAIEWLENYLAGWNGAVVVVSHDRYFLNKVVNRVLELSFNALELYRGNYAHYVQQRAERRARQEKEYAAQQAVIAKEEEFIRRNLAGQRTNEAKGRRKRLNRLKRDGLIERQRAPKTLALSLQADLRSGDLVLATHSLAVGYPDGDILLTLPDLEIRRGECVALLGPNGSGKTTFLRTILTEIPPKQGAVRLGAAVEIGYFAQIHAELAPQNTALDELLLVKHNMGVGEARNHLARFLFSGDDVFKKVGDLSGGERSRLALAKFALSGANFFILDEPTNHLDIPAQEVLESVLAGFNGTVLLVSHDRYFVDALATRLWVIEGNSITPVAGNYTTYMALKEAPSAALPKSPQKEAAQKTHRQAKAKKRAREKQARLIAQLEQDVEAAEAKLARLARQLEQAGFDQDLERLHQLGLEYRQTEDTLSNLLNRWIAVETTETEAP